MYKGYANMETGWLPTSGSYPTTNSSYPNAKYQLIELNVGEKVTISNSTSLKARVRCIDKSTNQVVGTVDSVGESASSYYITTASFGSGFTNGTITAKKDICLGILVFEDREDIKYTMINEGSTALPYEPYGNNWYIEKNIGKVVLNGSEYWAVNSNWDTSYPNILHIFTNDLSSTWKVGQNDFLSDKFKCATESGRNFNEEMINVHTTNASVYVFINFSRLGGVTSSSTTTEKVNAFKTWIASNNVELYYILKNPTYETITNENLIEQLNNIQNIELIENLCYVDWVGEEKPKMKLFCYLDKDKIIEEITG